MTTRIVAAVTLLLLAAPAAAQPEHPLDQAAMQEAMLKAATPGPFHACLARKAGNWRIAGRMWTLPGAEPQASESTATIEMILGGRYLMERMHGTTMGMPFEGLGLTGYDNTTGQVTAVWMDTMGTMTMVLTGRWDEPGAPLQTTGRYLDPVSGIAMDVRTLTTFLGEDESRFEYFATVPGLAEMKMMELVYTRER
ncbi:MAG: DUF1579 domain-containing protein [Candidatus Krumholzibacteriia bacterium]